MFALAKHLVGGSFKRSTRPEEVETTTTKGKSAVLSERETRLKRQRRLLEDTRVRHTETLRALAR